MKLRKLKLRLFQIIAIIIAVAIIYSVIDHEPKTVTGIESPSVIETISPTPNNTNGIVEGSAISSGAVRSIQLLPVESNSATVIPLKASGNVQAINASINVTSAATLPAIDYDSYGFTLCVREMMAKTLSKEADRLYVGDTEASKVVWTMLNRLDSGILWFGSNMAEILTKEDQYAYNENAPVTKENLELVNDVIDRWIAEKNGETNVGRTLPKDFYAFYGDGTTNFFWKWSSGGLGQPGDTKEYYDGSLGTPYAI